MTTPRNAHPALIAFPIALYGVTVLALLLHAATGAAGVYHLALYANIAGVVAALVALVPSYVDAANAPAFSGTRETGLREAAFNGLALLFFAASAAVIWKNGATNQELGDVVPLVLGAVGLASIGVAGWYGKALAKSERTSASVIRVSTRIL